MTFATLMKASTALGVKLLQVAQVRHGQIDRVGRDVVLVERLL